MTRIQKMVLGAAVLLYSSWLFVNWSRIAGNDDGLIRFVLGSIFSFLILMRWKRDDKVYRTAPSWLIPAGMIFGTLLAIVGLVFRVHQFEWLGIILLLYACLRWSLPERFGPDILMSLLLLYWVHPLPGQVFARLQFAMQSLSVEGSEWLLHAFNVKVWANALTLTTGAREFGVPEACSGMRTAVTVLLSVLGACMLLRSRWYEALLFVAIGLLQVLCLNIVRISGMIYIAPRMPYEWADTFLHDTLGIFLLVSIVLAQIEISAWRYRCAKRKRIKEGVERGELEPAERASPLPHFWLQVLRYGRIILAVIIAIVVVFFAIRQSRPLHRGTMIKGVVGGLLDSDPDVAVVAIREALESLPGDRDLLAQEARAMFARKNYHEALAKLSALPGEPSIFEQVLRSWCLMSLERLDEAIAIIDSLPEGSEKLPGVAVVKAQYAALQDQPDIAGEHAQVAAISHLTIGRVRALFPYLAAREQWAAIAGSVNELPHSDPLQALVEMYAHLRFGNLLAAGNVLRRALETWPDDKRFIRGILVLAVDRPGSDWESYFERSLKANLDTLGVLDLGVFTEYAFKMHRPDLAWLAYARLVELDPDAPARDLLPGMFAERWMRCRSRQIGVPADSAGATTDLGLLYAMTRNTRPMASYWQQVPMVETLGYVDRARARDLNRRFMEKSLERLYALEKQGAISEHEALLVPRILRALGHLDEAEERLRVLQVRNPQKRAEILSEKALLLDQRERWEQAYETVLEYAEMVERPTLTMEMILIDAMMNLNMGVGVLDVLRRSEGSYPGAGTIPMARAAVWRSFGYNEYALFVLGERGAQLYPSLRFELLRDTGRIQAARSLGSVLGALMSEPQFERSQMLALPPAEISVSNRWPAAFSSDEVQRQAHAASVSAAKAESPFVRDLRNRQASWLRTEGVLDGSRPADWAAIGRNPVERGIALHQLAVLLGRSRDYEACRQALEHALHEMPYSPILWRMLVALTEGELEIVESAAAACPEDPEIWLALLVTRFRADGDEGKAWIASEVSRVAGMPVFPVGTMIRAGSFLMRHGMLDSAAELARSAVERSEGMVAAYALAAECGVRMNDYEWVKRAAAEGARHAVEPGPFYRVLASAKIELGEDDADLRRALEQLKLTYPDERVWREQLGQSYFEKQEMKRALSVLAPLVASDAGSVSVQAILRAAEAARREGRLANSIEFLEKGRAAYPDNLEMLNNLVYYLAQSRQTLPRARQLVDELTEKGGDSYAVLDTVATVYMRCGEFEKARVFMDRALTGLDPEDAAAREVRLNAARLLFYQGDLEGAKRGIEEVRRSGRPSELVDMGVRDLLEAVRRAERRRESR